MPCHSYIPNLSKIESELSKIYNIYDDLNGNFEQFKFPHPKIHDLKCDEQKLHEETQVLCRILQNEAKIEKYSHLTQRWWLNHRVNDFKRLILESRDNDLGAIHKYLSEYERSLIHDRKFLNELVNDAFDKITERFNLFNESQNSEWQKNITRHSFIQAMSSFELFLELNYLKITGKENTDFTLFKYYETNRSFWKRTFGKSFDDWISFTDQFELKRYYEKYIQFVQADNIAKMYFDAMPIQSDENKNLIFTINDTINLIRILIQIKDEILKNE